MIVASTYNGESKVQIFLNSGEEQRFELPILVPLGNPSVQNETSLTSSISSIAVGDYDNDLDVDIAIAFPDFEQVEQVRWYFNEGNASFEFEGSIKDIGAPRLLESFSFAGKGFRGSPDVDVSGMGLVFKDLLVGSDTGIYWAVYDEIDKDLVSKKSTIHLLI